MTNGFLSDASLDHVTETALLLSEGTLRENGRVSTVLNGFGEAGSLLYVVQGPPDTTPWLHGDAVVLPAPLLSHAATIRDLFSRREVQAATLVSEFWTFPDEDLTAAQEYLAGRGPSPSQHPGRQEGVLVATLWPLGGYTRVDSRRIVRDPAGARLRPWASEALNRYRETDGSEPDSLMRLMSTWVEQCLPARGEEQ